MGLGKQSFEARFFLWGSVERLHELFPLILIENETRLIRESRFRFFTGRTDDEVGHVDALTLGRNSDEGFLAGSGAELQAPVSWLFGS
jgi:hypothetical protein